MTNSIRRFVPASALASTLLLAGAPPALAADSASLTITVTGIEHTEGAVRAEVYAGPDGFREPERAAARLAVAAEPGTVMLTAEALAPGSVAVIVYHDEDNDGEMDRFLGMMPTEGYGVSNNPTLSGPPDFDESAVLLNAGANAITVEMRY